MLLTNFESSQTKQAPCICCGSLKFKPVCLREDKTLVVHCQECHLESVNPLPTLEAMQENYQKEMIGNEPDSGVHSNYILEKGICWIVDVRLGAFLILQRNEAGIGTKWRFCLNI